MRESAAPRLMGFFFVFFFFFFFFFFHWHYSPLWVLACRTNSSIFSYPSPTLSIIIKSIQLFPFFDFRNNKFLTVWGF
jgi:hypothetical protein